MIVNTIIVVCLYPFLSFRNLTLNALFYANLGMIPFDVVLAGWSTAGYISDEQQVRYHIPKLYLIFSDFLKRIYLPVLERDP